MVFDKFVVLLVLFAGGFSTAVEDATGQKPETSLDTWQLKPGLKTNNQRENQLHMRVDYFEKREDDILKRMDHLETLEKNILLRMKSLEIQEENILRRLENLEIREKEMKTRMERIEIQENEINGRMEHLETREKEINRRLNHLESQENEALSRMEHLLSREINHSERMHTLEAHEKKTGMKDESIKWHNDKVVQTLLKNPGDEEEIIASRKDKDMPVVVRDIIQAPYIKQRVRRDQTPQAFFATLSRDVLRAGVHQIYVFDNVITNLGHGYNNHNGNFVAPMDGTYVFSATLMSMYKRNTRAAFFRNGKLVSQMYLTGIDSAHATASQTIILQLRQWDDVSIHNLDADTGLAGSHYSVFSGYLLYEGYPTPPVVGK
ncbi:uncharacterized protein LOC132737976 [Ruditapes philippinarum]|uniref:uncharacterized protein LOC132737976 n=1 Tax=Ruditapes philippinarum TaxID=129788 RepID=UPI00295BECBD|nr:uncharacterized protein LOC132737976 [Ruditapes philippinarum]